MKLATWLSTANIFPKTTGIVDMLFTESLSRRKKKIFQTHTPSEVFKMLKDAGIEGMELVVVSSTTDKEINSILELSMENNFPIFSIHQPLTNFFSISLEEVTRLIKIAHSVSARVVVLHMNAIYRNMLDLNFIEKLKQLENKYSVLIGIENMPKAIIFRSKKAIWDPKEFSSFVTQKGFKITLDTTHLGEVHGSLLDFYNTNKQQIVNIHISDYKNNGLRNNLSLTTGRHLAIGDGKLPIKELLLSLKQDNYQGLVTMEINSSLEKLLESARVINNVIKL